MVVLNKILQAWECRLMHAYKLASCNTLKVICYLLYTLHTAPNSLQACMHAARLFLFDKLASLHCNRAADNA